MKISRERVRPDLTKPLRLPVRNDLTLEERVRTIPRAGEATVSAEEAAVRALLHQP